jgi:hypothetical protein
MRFKRNRPGLPPRQRDGGGQDPTGIVIERIFRRIKDFRGHCHGNRTWRSWGGVGKTERMKPPLDPHYRHRFPAAVISQAVWLSAAPGIRSQNDSAPSGPTAQKIAGAAVMAVPKVVRRTGLPGVPLAVCSEQPAGTCRLDGGVRPN